MARGWESKAVEAQIEEKQTAKSSADKPASYRDIQLKVKQADLLLSRKHVLQQLEQSQNSRYSEQLRRSLQDLDSQLARVESF